MKIQNTLVKGILDTDTDERFVENGKMIDSDCFLVSTTQGLSRGVGKNVLGNVKVTDYEIIGSKNYGTGSNPSKNKVYNLIKGTFIDAIYEYDSVTKTSVRVIQSTSGGVLNFRAKQRVTKVDILVDPNGDGDLICFSGDSNPPRMFNIEKAKNWAVDGFTNNDISVMKPSPIFAPDVTLTTSVEGVQNNFIKDKFIVFATRYKWEDGLFTAPSSWSKIAFEPRKFELNYQTNENNGMLNLSNAVDVFFKTGEKGVVQVDLLFRESNSDVIYVVQEFIKANEGWGDNQTKTFQFSKSKIFTVLSTEQYYRNFDYVPLQAGMQAIIDTRLAYTDFVNDRDLGVVVDYTVALETLEPALSNIAGTIINFTDILTYENVVDFIQGVPDGGSAPTDQLNYLTNEFNINLGAVGADTASFIVKVTPKPQFLAIPYTVTFKNGATTVFTSASLTGVNTVNYSTQSNQNIKIYLTSADGLIYDCETKYNLTFLAGPLLQNRSKYIYTCLNQLSYPNSTGYPSSLVGDTIIDAIASYNFAGFQFTAGNQIRINFELISSLEANFSPSVTFFYNLTDNYTNLADFITRSAFLSQLETVFSLTFKNDEISNAGTIVSYGGFDASYIGSILYIKTPKVVYTVTEPSGAVVNKNEFYLISATNVLSVSGNAFSSMHSNRDVEVGIEYLDAEGRKTTVLASKTNSIFIPAETSDKVNKVKVTMISPPPTWAKYYKFLIKQTKRNYETLYANIVYKEGIYRWIKLIGDDKNKIKEGGILILKSDYSGPLESEVKVKIIEIKDQPANFISNNLLASGEELLEESGLYFKIKQGNFNMNITDESFATFSGSGKRRYASRSFVTTAPYFGVYDGAVFKPIKVNAGSVITFSVQIQAFGSIEFNHKYEFNTIAQEDYNSVKLWWDAEIGILSDWLSFANDYLNDYQFDVDDRAFQVKPWRDGTASRDIITDVIFDINFSGGTLVFETEALEQLNSSYFETPETFTITAGAHQFTTHTLNNTFNCFSFGNGVESCKIQDGLTTKSFSIDSNANDVDKDGYKQRRRFADITYSGVYNANTNVNRLNEFNLSLANFKDDIVKSYGKVTTMNDFETNLEIIQDDKYSIIYYGKDQLYNADGSTNLQRIEDVLGQQDALNGEYGCQHRNAFDFYGFDRYFADVKRGAILKKSNNGIFNISNQGKRAYFKELFRNNVIDDVNIKYDQFNDFAYINVKYNGTEAVTWVYSDKDNGWLGKLPFSPEDMIRINGDFVSFLNGEIYIHNQEKDGSANNFNTFYGVRYPSKFSIFMNQEPSTRKNFLTGEFEGNKAFDMKLTTDFNEGYIKKEDFTKEENVFRGYIRTSNSTIDTSLLSSQGIGFCTVNGLVLSFIGKIPNEVSIGDKIINLARQTVGIILEKTDYTLTLNAVANIASDEFVIAQKPQSIERAELLGYYMKVECELDVNEFVEIFAINSEISKSFT
jgi:hypothetical protein